VFYQINAYTTPQNNPNYWSTSYATPTSTTTVPPPPTYNCYQATFKYKVTNTGNTPLDNVTVCDNFYDQLINNDNGGGASPFCGYYVVCPPPVLVAGPADGDDGNGSFAGNASFTGTNAGSALLGGGDALLLPGTSIEFSVVLRFCIDPTVTIRIVNDATVYAQAPNEALVVGESRGFIPIVGPSLCFTKAWASGYPLQVTGQDGFFTGQLVYTVYNDGDRRVLDVNVYDEFTNNHYTVTHVDNVSTASASTRQLVSPCSTITGESPSNSSWTGLNTTTPVNSPPLPYLDRSEMFTVYTPTFTFQVDSVHASQVNTATVTSETIYDDPSRNNSKTLTQLRAYAGYSGTGSDLIFGVLQRQSSLTVNPANAFRICPLTPQNAQPIPASTIAHAASIVSSTPGDVRFDVSFLLPYENSVNGSVVNVARVDHITVASTTSFPSGVSSLGISFTDPSPIEAGGLASLIWTEHLQWTGSSGGTPALPYLTYTVTVGNNVALANAVCTMIGEAILLTDPFLLNCPSGAQAPTTNPLTSSSFSAGAVFYDVPYRYVYQNGNTITEAISVTRTTGSYPAGITPISLLFTPPSLPIAANALVTLSWTERVEWNGTLHTQTPPTMPQLTYNVHFTNTAGFDQTCAYTGGVVTLVNPL
jgi:hypothetical protein